MNARWEAICLKSNEFRGSAAGIEPPDRERGIDSGSAGTKTASFYRIFCRDGRFDFALYVRRDPVPTCCCPMATITKRELVMKITDELGARGIDVTQQLVTDVLQLLMDEITDSLGQGDSVALRRFGSFEVREMKAKIGRNPKNPARDVRIPARAAVKFKPGKEMKDKVAATLKVIREKKV